jgi:hypothetical protein
MKSRSLAATALGSVIVMCAAVLAACGGTDDEKARAERKVPKLASAAVIDGDPYAIACGHVRDQQKWADATRQATVAIARHEQLPRLNDLQATQTIFYALTEVCKGRPASFEPAETAVRAVRAGKYSADLGTP